MSNSYTEGNDCNDKRWRADTVRLAVAILESEKDYRTVTVLGRGTYGDVFRMYDPDRDVDVAVKVVTADNIAEVEMKKWPELRHPNVVPVLEFFMLSPIDVAIFIMPVQDKSLHDVLIDKHFSKWGGCLPYLKGWIYEALCGLSYMHSEELCHLDLKADNVLISSNSTAMLCDFSFLNFTTKPLKRYDLGLPYIYRPPESCRSFGNNIKIDGVAYDMWGFGSMVVEIFTHFILAKSVSSGEYWHKDVYPILFKAIQENKFKELMFEIIPSAEVNTAQVKVALNFIHGFLRYEPKKRLTARQAMQHMFLNRGIGLGPAIDPIWIHKRALKCNLKAIKHKVRINDGVTYVDSTDHVDMPVKSPDNLDEYKVCPTIQDTDSSKSSLETRHRKLKIRQQTPGVNIMKSKVEDVDSIWSDNVRDENSESEDRSIPSSGYKTLNLCCSRLPNEKQTKKIYWREKDTSAINTRTWNKGKEKKTEQLIHMASKTEVINSENSLDEKNSDCDYKNCFDLLSQSSIAEYDTHRRYSSHDVRGLLSGHCKEDLTLQHPSQEKAKRMKGSFEINNSKSWTFNGINQHQTENLSSSSKSSASEQLLNEMPGKQLLKEKLLGNNSSQTGINDAKTSDLEVKLAKKGNKLDKTVSEFSEKDITKRCGEAYHRMNTLRKQLNILDEKFSELENILVCKECSTDCQSLCDENLPINSGDKDVLNAEIKIAIDEESGGTVEVNKDVKVLNVADACTTTSPFNEMDNLPERNHHFGDPSIAQEVCPFMVEAQPMPVTIHGLENSYVRTEAIAVGNGKKKQKCRMSHRRRILNWMRKKYRAMEKMIKCMPYNIIK